MFVRIDRCNSFRGQSGERQRDSHELFQHENEVDEGLSYQEAACQVCFAANQRALCSTLKHNQLFVL